MEFIKFPWRVYQDDPYWVPPLINERKSFFNPHKNPFFQHADVELFLARRHGEVVGTIAALINHNHNVFHDEQVGFFGFFEALEDYAVAEALLGTARDWVRDKGMDAIRGPMNFSTNDECGLLVDGFDSSPVVLMTYNPRYYVHFIERFGFHKAMDLYAYTLETAAFGLSVENLPPKLLRVAEAARRRERVTIRNVNMTDFDAEVRRARKIYNSAWEKNWGFVPMTDAEFDYLAHGLKPLLDPDLIFVAEVDGQPVAISITLPDLNQPLLHVNGRLFPTGWLKLLWYRRKTDTVRVFALGVIETYRHRGIDALLYLETARQAFAKGYVHAEMSWILENNMMMNRAIQFFGGKVYKTYRVYEMAL